MRKVISFMHVSLDGYVSGPNGELDWVKINQEIFDYVGTRIHRGDTALYGRRTYQMMEDYWPKAGAQPDATPYTIEHSKWYAGVHKVVLSNTLNDSNRVNTEIINSNLADRINALKQQSGEDVLLFGSPTATHALMELNLIDGFWLFVNPVILGRGISLFEGRKDKIKLELLPAGRRFTSGVVELNYVVDRQ